MALLIQRKKIHINHGIIGSSDMDEVGLFMAKIQSAVIVTHYVQDGADRKTPWMDAEEDG